MGQLEPRFQGEAVVPGEYFFGFYKSRHILLSDSANCTVLRAVVFDTIPARDRQTDRQTDGIAEMRALRRAVKMHSSGNGLSISRVFMLL